MARLPSHPDDAYQAEEGCSILMRASVTETLSRSTAVGVHVAWRSGMFCKRFRHVIRPQVLEPVLDVREEVPRPRGRHLLRKPSNPPPMPSRSRFERDAPPPPPPLAGDAGLKCTGS